MHVTLSKIVRCVADNRDFNVISKTIKLVSLAKVVPNIVLNFLSGETCEKVGF